MIIIQSSRAWIGPLIAPLNLELLYCQEMEKKQSAGNHEFNLFKKDSSPFYYVRIMYGGRRRKFSTGETTLRRAKNKATAIVADIRSRGFDEAVKIHSRRRDKLPNDPSIEEFVELARTIFQKDLRDPPSRPTYERYLRDISRVASTSGAKRLSQLEIPRIEKFVATYHKGAEEKGRNPQSARTSVQTIIRNCSSLFSPRMLRAYRKRGLDELENPFSGIDLPPVRITPYSPLPVGILSEICKKAETLKSGDPTASAPKKVRNRALGPDFRKPQIASYLLFLLELGLGLRRNEADKAEWAWILPSIDGRHIMEVRETNFFRPKSRQRRILPVPKQILDVLEQYRRKDDPFIVPGLSPRIYQRHEEPTNIPYRCDEAHRALVSWLRLQGVEDDKPCHKLRKEFGSAVATTFGLFAAQRMLGHSSPLVTEAHYAGLTQLPQLEQAGFYDSLCGNTEPEEDEASSS